MSHLHGGWGGWAQPGLSGGSVVHPCPLPLAWQADIPASLGEDMEMSSTSLQRSHSWLPEGWGGVGWGGVRRVFGCTG